MRRSLRQRALVGLTATLALATSAAPPARAADKKKSITAYPAPFGSKPSIFRVRLPEGVSPKGGPAVLKIDGVESEGGLILRVFVAAPEANLATSMDDKRYAGNVSIVAAGKTAKGKKPPIANAALELTPEARALVAAAGELVVTIVPTDVDGKEPAAASFTIKKIALDL
ncbi:MAG: hypothetical protein JST92_12355 [Deltaproteobacteria bacterium]|nr:hypothetical protein [Deltaproteobacteria bacterium]